MEHGAVADTQPSGDIRSIQNRVDLVHGQVADERLSMALGGDGEDLPGLVQRSRVAELDIAHERFHCCQSDVAAGRAATAIDLEVSEESHDERSVEVFEVKLRWSAAEAFGGEQEQQAEGIGVAVAGMRAIAALDGKVVAQEVGDQRCDRSHAKLPATKFSPAAAMSAIRSGVASRYQ